jgi:hypothetical protein
VLKSIKEIGFEQYYQAEQTGFVLYLEGSTDLAILRGLSRLLSHPASEVLERPFVHYVANLPNKARDHFYGLREARPTLVGFALFDRLENPLNSNPSLVEHSWARREIENYICQQETLLSYAEAFAVQQASGPLFESGEIAKTRTAMQESIVDLVPRAALRDASDPWWINTKTSDDFLRRVFGDFFARLGLPNLMTKSDFHVLVEHVPTQAIDPEVEAVLDKIVNVARTAKPTV